MRYRARFVPDETLLSHELRRKLWEGLIPLKIDLALNDNNTLERPRSLYVSNIYNLILCFVLDNGSQRELFLLHLK